MNFKNLLALATLIGAITISACSTPGMFPAGSSSSASTVTALNSRSSSAGDVCAEVAAEEGLTVQRTQLMAEPKPGTRRIEICLFQNKYAPTGNWQDKPLCGQLRNALEGKATSCYIQRTGPATTGTIGETTIITYLPNSPRFGESAFQALLDLGVIDRAKIWEQYKEDPEFDHTCMTKMQDVGMGMLMRACLNGNLRVNGLVRPSHFEELILVLDGVVLTTTWSGAITPPDLFPRLRANAKAIARQMGSGV